MNSPKLHQQESNESNMACGKEDAAILLPTEQVIAKKDDDSSVIRHEEGLSEDIWMHSYNTPHSCRHCGQITVVSDPKPLTVAIQDYGSAERKADTTWVRLCLAENINSIRQAMEDNCPLFDIMFGKYKDLEDSEMLFAFDVDGSGMVQAKFWHKSETVGGNGYGDLMLLYRKDLERKISPFIDGLKAIIQPNEARDTLTCDPGATDSFKFCRGLMSRCMSCHPLCRMPRSCFTPTRLLDVTEHDLKLVETSEMAEMDKPEQHGWCALSYVWGGNVPLKTTKATLLAHKKGITVDIFPRTMKDAALVCRGLGIRYLWIDALCIIQDDQDDLHEQLSHMPEVFQYATLTISATSSASSRNGFFSRRGYRSKGFPAINARVMTDSGEGIILFPYMDGDYGISGASQPRIEPIIRRAWTYQEAMLSPRILNYRTHYLEWICRTEKGLVGTPGCELFQRPMSTSKIDHFGLKPMATWETEKNTYRLSSTVSWADVVHEYTSRELSSASDRLRALSAIARVFQLETGNRYLAGLWKEDIPAALCWGNGTAPGTRNDPDPAYKKISPRPKEYRAPSWSWASIDTPVFYWPHEAYTPFRILELRVLSAGVTPMYPNGEFDSVASAFLTICGPVCPVPLDEPVKLREIRTENPTSLFDHLWSEELYAYVFPDALEDSDEIVNTFWFLLLAEQDRSTTPDAFFRQPTTKFYGLVLRESKEHSGTYSRFGYFWTGDLFYPDSEWRHRPKVNSPFTPATYLDNFEDKVITLI